MVVYGKTEIQKDLKIRISTRRKNNTIEWKKKNNNWKLKKGEYYTKSLRKKKLNRDRIKLKKIKTKIKEREREGERDIWTDLENKKVDQRKVKEKYENKK